MKILGQGNDLVDRIKKDPYFKPVLSQLAKILDPSTFVGRAPSQVRAPLVNLLIVQINIGCIINDFTFLGIGVSRTRG